jgi:hypothetical protein
VGLACVPKQPLFSEHELASKHYQLDEETLASHLLSELQLAFEETLM